VAWLSDADNDARDRIADAEYQLVDGTIVATSKADLLDSSLLAAINLDETGTTVSDITQSWTGTNADGTGSTRHCGYWATDAVNEFGIHGDNNSVIGTWTAFGQGLGSGSKPWGRSPSCRASRL
jgi:hypothetical protein